MSAHSSSFAAGAAQAIGQDLTTKLIQTPQGQQALQFTANTIAQTGALAVGGVAAVAGGVTAAGTAVVGATTATIAAGAAVAVAAAPVLLAMGCITALGVCFAAWLED